MYSSHNRIYMLSSTVGEKYDLRQLQQALRGTRPKGSPRACCCLFPTSVCLLSCLVLKYTCDVWTLFGETVYTWSGNRAKMLFLLCRVDTFAVIVVTRRRTAQSSQLRCCRSSVCAGYRDKHFSIEKIAGRSRQ